VSGSNAWIDSFVKRLRSLDPPDHPENADRAALARLRQGLGKPATDTLTRLGWLFAAVPDWATDRAVLVAGLFATNPMTGGGGTLGKALRRYRDATGAEESADKRFAYLVDSEAEDLPDRLRQVVKLLKVKDVPIDYRRLLEDLLGWNWESRKVQWDWSRDYWKALADEPEDDAQPEASTPATEGAAP
jgi:CRISPR type I-E-associated protein CasB/Cse2